MEKILIYQLVDGQMAIDVTLENDTIWLTQNRWQSFSNTQRPAITKHLSNLFKNNELDEYSVCSILEHTASDGKNYKLQYYNLDAILSVGYRVNSKKATHFRIWANKVLKDYLVKGYALNKTRLKEQSQQFEALKTTVKFLGNVAGNKMLNNDEASGLFKVLTDYTYALDVLDKYDHRNLTIEATHKQPSFVATYNEAMKAIKGLRTRFGGSNLLGNEKDESFKSSIATIYQSFGGTGLYPSVEEKAANLLYFVVKKLFLFRWQ